MLGCIFGKRQAAKREESMIAMREQNKLIIQDWICGKVCGTNPGTKWRWVCCPQYLFESGGVGRIELLGENGGKQLLEVCLTIENSIVMYLHLYVLDNVKEFIEGSDDKVTVVSAPVVVEDTVDEIGDATHEIMQVTPVPGVKKPTDEEGVGKWFNIALIGPLENLIAELHAEGEVCLTINSAGEASVEDLNGKSKKVAEFVEMPEKTHWNLIIDKLIDSGLSSEVRGEDLFISWA